MNSSQNNIAVRNILNMGIYNISVVLTPKYGLQADKTTL